ncbi:MAG TPA: hypothetical protein VG448_01750 [Solirubrobacterales bacterium]|nr:hypothetical protein [Solirubrobacterales bacterium]
MQKPLFRRFSVDEKKFWLEVQGLSHYYAKLGHQLISRDTIYLSHILSYVRSGEFKGLNNAVLREIGGELDFYPGVPDVFERLSALVSSSARFQRHEISVEHYVISTGLRQIICGSAVANKLDEIWACEFLETTAPPGYLESGDPLPNENPTLTDIAYSIDNTTKTRAVFEINKGVNKYPEISVNQKMDEEDRRVPFGNMIYVADGPSDVPVFSIVNRFGGQTLGVYGPDSEEEFRQMADLQEEGRVRGMGPADYRPGTQTTRWLERAVKKIASRISDRREQTLRERVGTAPVHIVEDGRGGDGSSTE